MNCLPRLELVGDTSSLERAMGDNGSFYAMVMISVTFAMTDINFIEY